MSQQEAEGCTGLEEPCSSRAVIVSCAGDCDVGQHGVLLFCYIVTFGSEAKLGDRFWAHRFYATGGPGFSFTIQRVVCAMVNVYAKTEGVSRWTD